jgi:SAM-dependent methyltransferase
MPLGHERTIETTLGEVMLAVRVAEREGVAAPDILPRLDPVRAVHARSELWRRLQAWPRGITADYVTLDLLLNGMPTAARGSVARALEDLLLTSPVVAHHRATIVWQRDLFQARIVAHAGERRVLYLGCGSARDISTLGAEAARPDVTLWLNDIDAEALSTAERHLAGLGWHAHTDQGHASKRMGALGAHGPFDLVMLGTLPDQISDAQLEWLLPQALRATAPGGVLCFASAQAPYPSREWLAYCADWRFFERTGNRLASLLKRSGVGRWATVSSPLPELLSFVTVTRP